jgi:hypothetical protein
MTARKRTPARTTAASADLLGRLTPTGINLPPGLDFDEWAAIGDRLLEFRSAIRWAIGDWWIYGGHAYGDRAAQALDSDRWSFGSFMNMGTVARRFETSRRCEVLSWSHHAAVAAKHIDDAQADELLDKAAAGSWSVAQLRDAVRQLPAIDTTGDEAKPHAGGTFTIPQTIDEAAADLDRMGHEIEEAERRRDELIAAYPELLWQVVDAETARYRAGVVEIFRRYEGETTDAGDTVTVETFAEHVGIPVEVFREWLDGSS